MEYFFKCSLERWLLLKSDKTTWEREETNCLLIHSHPDKHLAAAASASGIQSRHTRKCPGILTQLPRLSLRCVTPSGVMCEPQITDEYPAIHPPLKVHRRRTHRTVLLLSTGGDRNRMEGISEAARSFVEKIYLKLMTFLDCSYGGTGLFIICVATNI